MNGSGSAAGLAPVSRQGNTAADPERVPTEHLTSVRLDDDWHARYPSASRTLCALDATEGRPSRHLPTCGVCSRVARALHRIDGSMPADWLPEAA